tara:strand:- start:1176 stop:1769 length:594 start_codon:yes stop_codon:yes gene_type:complete
MSHCPHRIFLGLSFVGLLALTACDQAAVKSYTIPKEQPVVTSEPAEPNPMRPLPGMAEQAAAAGELQYTVPSGWRQLPASGIRKATLQIEDAELSVLVFPGDVGGELANINRWREQIGLAAIEESALATITRELTISQHPASYVDLIGPEKSIKGAILPFHGRTWFFKLLGPSDSVQANEAGLLEFLDSVQLPDNAH